MLEAIDHLQAAPAAVAAHGVGRVGHQLQLFEDEAGHQQGLVDETGLYHVGDAGVDQHRGVQEDVLAGRARRGAVCAAANDAAQQAEEGTGVAPDGGGTQVGQGQGGDEGQELPQGRMQHGKR